MRILYLSQYFPPEIGATQTRAYEMAHNLVELGHQVTILAEIPNHPTGIIPPEYHYKIFERSVLDGIDIIRVWVKTSPVKTAFTRMAFYLTFMLNAFFAGIFIARLKYDLVYASSPPLFVGCAGWALSLIKRVPFILEIRDLWPAVAISLGELTGSRSLHIAEVLEKFLYDKAAGIVAVTQGFCQYIQSRGVPGNKITWIPNGTTPEIFDPSLGDGGLRQRLGMEGKFIVTYAGLHGIAQGLQTILNAARLLCDYTEILFLFIGEGSGKVELLRQKEKEDIRNVIFLPEVPRENIVYYINMSDILLVPLKKDPIFESFIPTKMYDYMACAKPILLSVPGEAKKILEEAEAGIYITPEDSNQLKDTILDLYHDRKKLEKYGKKGREYVIRNYSRASQARQLAGYLQNQIKKP